MGKKNLKKKKKIGRQAVRYEIKRLKTNDTWWPGELELLSANLILLFYILTKIITTQLKFLINQFL